MINAQPLLICCPYFPYTHLSHYLYSFTKSRDITLLTKVNVVKAMVFSVVLYGCESWTIKMSIKELMLSITVLEYTPESLLDNKESKPVYS